MPLTIYLFSPVETTAVHIFSYLHCQSENVQKRRDSFKCAEEVLRIPKKRSVYLSIVVCRSVPTFGSATI